MKLTANFRSEEFACKCGCGFEAIDLQLVVILQGIRDHLDKPLVVMSGCRCKKHNENVDGAKNSAHMQGKAVDLACLNSSDRYSIVHHALASDICRVGIARGFIHLDIATDRVQDVLWLY